MTAPTDPYTIDVIRRLKYEGKHNKDIAMSVGMPVWWVESLCHRHDIRRPSSGRLDIPVGIRLKLKYVAEAKRREMPLNRLMCQMLKVIADDDLFTAILDDKK